MTDPTTLIARINDALPKVGEPENVWCMLKAEDLRVIVAALATPAPAREATLVVRFARHPRSHAGEAMNPHQSIAASIPQLARGQVWCRTCGGSRPVNSAHALAHGWPKCCGYTMTIDSPEEQRPSPTASGNESERSASFPKASGSLAGAADGEPKPIERCECGYPMPCSVTTPITFCRAQIGAADGGAKK